MAYGLKSIVLTFLSFWFFFARKKVPIFAWVMSRSLFKKDIHRDRQTTSSFFAYVSSSPAFFFLPDKKEDQVEVLFQPKSAFHAKNTTEEYIV